MKINRNVSKAAMKVAKQVLTEAADTEHFFDMSDGERLLWMLARSFEIGLAKGMATQCVSTPCKGCFVTGCQGPSRN